MADLDPTFYTDGEIDVNPTDNPTLESIVEGRYSRRAVITRSAGLASVVSMAGFLGGCGGDDAPAASTATITGSGVQTSSGAIGQLSATSSGDSLTGVQWTQTSGPSVALENATTLNARFLAPSVAANTPVGFRVTGADSRGLIVSSDVTVMVEPGKIGFSAVAKNLNDIVTVPAGYQVTILYRFGDPINAATPAFANDGTDTNIGNRSGDQHDGLYYFGLAASGSAPDPTSNSRGMLCINHENIVQRYLHPNGATSTAGVRPAAEVIKEIEAHGVSVIETARGANGVWAYNRTSALNRRITPLTPMQINGPVRGNALARTRFSPDGTMGRGTLNNCANGFTPWGTYITAEENWAGYFRRDPSDVGARTGTKSQTALARYGRAGSLAGGAPGAYGWSTAAGTDANATRFSKFNITIDPAAPADGTGDFRNEINQFGYSVEIDPYDPTAVPRKRTAMGRMAKEGAWPGLFVSGVRPAWYMGDDSGGEYMYKFVSTAPWAPADASAANRMATGDKYLDSGILYAARFNADGTGEWLPLVFGQGNVTAANAAYSFADQGDVCIHSRLAADAQGATRMDRPEWTAVNPGTGEVYLTLTQGPNRNGTTLPIDAANPRVYVDPPSTTRSNRNGHIIRLRETGNTTEALTFRWDIYLFASGSDLEATNINLSGLSADNDLSNPDGLWFSRPQNAGGLVSPLLWIQTDDGSVFTDVTNCMMLVGQPGSVGDGTTRMVTSTLADGTTRTQSTFIGAAPGVKLKRFMVGPKECEITGIDSTPDGKTLFVNIQHPGEDTTTGFPNTFPSNWPASQTNPNAVSRPRSATIVVTRTDGGVVGMS